MVSGHLAEYAGSCICAQLSAQNTAGSIDTHRNEDEQNKVSNVAVPSSLQHRSPRAIWIKSSQSASNIYEAGSKLWTKSDLKNIEQQLTQCERIQCFTVRRIDGTVLEIENHLFGESSPIWCVQP